MIVYSDGDGGFGGSATSSEHAREIFDGKVIPDCLMSAAGARSLDVGSGYIDGDGVVMVRMRVRMRVRMMMRIAYASVLTFLAQMLL